MESQVADDADNLESPLDQTRNVFNICKILNGRQESRRSFTTTSSTDLRCFFFQLGRVFYYAVNCGRKYKKGNLKDHLSRSGVQEARCQKIRNSAKEDFEHGKRFKARIFNTCSRASRARRSNCWGAFPPMLRGNIAHFLSREGP